MEIVVGILNSSEESINACKNTWANKNVFFFSEKDGWNVLLQLYEINKNANFYYITTDDTYIRYYKLKSWLSNFNTEEKLYIGGDDEEINILEYKFSYHPISPGIIFSNKLMNFLCNLIPSWLEYWNSLRFPFWLNSSFDVSLGFLIEKYENSENIKSIKQLNFFTCNWKGYKNGCICCSEKNLKTLIACSNMSTKDMISIHSFYSFSSKTNFKK